MHQSLQFTQSLHSKSHRQMCKVSRDRMADSFLDSTCQSFDAYGMAHMDHPPNTWDAARIW